MKTLTCQDLGAPTCTHEYKANTYEELMAQMHEHVAADPVHEPERQAMAAATPEQLAEWDAKWRATFAAKPDEAPAQPAPTPAAPSPVPAEPVAPPEAVAPSAATTATEAITPPPAPPAA